jgi:hypothetical protein
MSISRLATVELQLCMHYCDLYSCLALARCSQHTLAAASDRFAWKYAAPLKLECGFQEHGRRRHSPMKLRLEVNSSLLRFGCIALKWFMTEGYPVPTEGDFTRVAALPLIALTILGFHVFRAKHARWLLCGVQQLQSRLALLLYCGS